MKEKTKTERLRPAFPVQPKGKIFGIRETYVILFCMVAIFLLYNTATMRLRGFTVWDDEFGYLGSAAYFTGHNWSGSLWDVLYYSYGYSLVLAPLLKIFSDPGSIYRAAVAVNGLFAAGIFPIAYSVGKKYYPGTDKKLLLAVCVCIVIYPGYISNSNMILPECFLAFLFWGAVWLISNSEKRLWQMALLGAVLPYIYVLHQRGFGILLTGILLVLMMKYFEEISWHQLAAFGVPLFLAFCCHTYFKKELQTALWQNSPSVSVNDFSGQTAKILHLFTGPGLRSFFLEFCGQLFYLGAATFCIAFVGAYVIAKRTWTPLRRTLKIRERTADAEAWPFLFLFLSAVTTFLISAVFMYYAPSKIDHLIYGRYNEIFIGPFLLFGLLGLPELAKNRLRSFLISGGIVAACGTAAIYNISKTGFSEINFYSIPGFFWAADIVNHRFLVVLMVSLLLSAVIFFLATERRKVFCRWTAVFLVMLTFSVSGFQSEKNTLRAQVNADRPQKIADYIEKNTAELPVYFLISQDTSYKIIRDDTQLYLMNRPLISLKAQDLQKHTENKLLIVQDKQADDMSAVLGNGYRKAADFQGYGIWVSEEAASRLGLPGISLSGAGTLSFGSGSENNSRYLLTGLSSPENGFTWSDAKEVRFQFTSDRSGGNLKLTAHIAPFLYPGLSAQTVTVLVNGKQEAVWKVDKENEYTAELPSGDLRSGKILLTFQISDPKSPKDAGESQDDRLLGIRFYEMSIQ